ncbi:MAG TPA: ABC transporter permease [Syntrophomonadaceae bacterium]|nr:ABC transporter permease [Syntrophomonadaceae bacterium]
MEEIGALWLQRNDIWEIIRLSVFVSGSAVLISSLLGIPAGAWLGLTRFAGKALVLRITITLMALPPVLAGLIVYLLLSHSGPLGSWEILFTPTAMIIAQCLLVIPIIVGLCAAAIAGKENSIHEHALSLGATRAQAMRTVIGEARTGILAAVMTGFGRAFAEVGAVMMVGGNIKHFSRVLTTSIVLETRQGNFDIAIALGVILLILSFIVSSIALSSIQESI